MCNEAIGDDGDMTQQTPTRTPQRRLERSREDRLFAGVAGGLGINLGINPWWVRFAFIVLAFFGGFGVILYLAAWVVIPDEGEKDPIVTRWIANFDTSDGAMVFGAVLLGGAAILVISNVSSAPGSLVLAGVLFVVGLLLYRGDFSSERRDQQEGASQAGSDDRDVDVVQDAKGDASAIANVGIADTRTADTRTDTVAGRDVAPVPPSPPRAPRPPRERSMLGRLTIAVGLIILAGMAMIDIAFARVEIEPVVYAATAVAVIGVGLIVGSWIGRARWLIIIGVLVLPALWFTALWPRSFDFTAGEVTYSPASVSEVDSPYTLGFGSMTIDLTALTPDELASIGMIEASVGMGEVVVILPTGSLFADIHASVGMGSVQGPFEQANGIGVDVTRSVGQIVATEGTTEVVNLNLEAGMGLIEIQTAIGIDGGSNG